DETGPKVKPTRMPATMGARIYWPTYSVTPSAMTKREMVANFTKPSVKRLTSDGKESGPAVGRLIEEVIRGGSVVQAEPASCDIEFFEIKLAPQGRGPLICGYVTLPRQTNP